MTTHTQLSKLDELIERMESATFHHPSKTDITDALTVAFRRMGQEARTELAALRRRAEDAEMIVRAFVKCDILRPQFTNEPWQFRAGQGRWTALDIDPTGLPVLTDEAREALK